MAEPAAQPAIKKKPGVVPSLTREAILIKALELADEQGIQNVSMRKLAAALGKAPMALYTYFDSVQEIHAGVVALAFREVDADPIPGERWDDTLRRTTRSIRQMYLDHINAELYRVELGGYSAALEEHTARIYALHSNQGIPADLLRRLWCLIDAFLGGFMPAELQEIRDHPEHPDPAGRPWIETAETAYSEETFESGIEIIIAGVRHLAAPDPCDWHTPGAEEVQPA